MIFSRTTITTANHIILGPTFFYKLYNRLVWVCLNFVYSTAKSFIFPLKGR